MSEMILFLTLLFIGFMTVDKHYDIRNYYDKPYCETTKVGNEEIKRCYKIVKE